MSKKLLVASALLALVAQSAVSMKSKQGGYKSQKYEEGVIMLAHECKSAEEQREEAFFAAAGRPFGG